VEQTQAASESPAHAYTPKPRPALMAHEPRQRFLLVPGHDVYSMPNQQQGAFGPLVGGAQGLRSRLLDYHTLHGQDSLLEPRA
jgi:hypothetical protein